MSAGFNDSAGFFCFLQKTVRFLFLKRLTDRGQSRKALGKEVTKVKHILRISVSDRPEMSGIITCRNITIRDRLLRFLIGDRRRVTVIIPGDSVGEISICKSEGEEENGKDEVSA